MRFVQLQFLAFISLRLALCSTGVNCFSGAAVFFGIEKFTFSESVYFVDVTVTTVGFGDSNDSPTTLTNI